MTTTTTFKSQCERNAAPIIAQLGGFACETFAPLLAQTYEDTSAALLHGKPDFLIERGGGYTFIEMKDGTLNDHQTQASSTAALRKAYGELFGRCGDHLHQSALASALHGKNLRGRMLAREHAFHNSLWKVAALQATHGYQRYLVVFRGNPTGRDAERYIKAGLVFCTLQTLPDFLQKIELMRHGFFIPLQHNAKNYSFTVTPDPSSKGLSQSNVALVDHARFLDSAATARAAIAAQQAQDAADWEAGIRPY